MTISEYLASLKHKKVAVIGIGVSNTPLIKMLLRAEISVTACDKSSREALGDIADELESLGAELRLGDDYLDHLHHDVIFRTPGLRPDVPALEEARAQGAEITSEMEVFFKTCPCKIIAVTGSDGKTTTTTIISELLKAAHYNVYVGGNIGKPLLADVAGMEREDIVVLELSSFQLMTMNQSPDIAVVTNVTPNHLDVHKSMSEYIAAKENLFRYQSADALAVFNLDNDITRAFSETAPGRTVCFSRKEILASGVYLKDGVIWSGDRAVLPIEDILIPGTHNVENYMAAIAAVESLVSDEVICKVAKNFGGVEHRIELVRELHGVRYYNDSIASSPTRTIAGLRSFKEKVILIAGGYDKKIPFDELGPEIISHVKYLVLTGDTAPKIRAAVEESAGYNGTNPEIVEYGDFDRAVLAAHQAAREGDVVIMSPACASFDKFKNFMIRGNAFKKIINELE